MPINKEFEHTTDHAPLCPNTDETGTITVSIDIDARNEVDGEVENLELWSENLDREVAEDELPASELHSIEERAHELACEWAYEAFMEREIDRGEAIYDRLKEDGEL